jgi:predicted DNA-binding WGR domain protein
VLLILRSFMTDAGDACSWDRDWYGLALLEQRLHRFWENHGSNGQSRLHEHPPCHLGLVSFVRGMTEQKAGT